MRGGLRPPSENEVTFVIQKNWQELIKPNKQEVTPGFDEARIGTIVVEPLERGFGMTLGNALRRVLLSSLQGAAVTAVQIDGVLHEFSSVPGVREDVTDIVLNLKSLSLRYHGDEPRRISLAAEGPTEVTAGMIDASHDVEIVTPDLVICTLDEGTKVNIDLILPLDRLKELISHNRINVKVKGTVVRRGSAGMAICFEEDYQIVPLHSPSQ